MATSILVREQPCAALAHCEEVDDYYSMCTFSSDADIVIADI